MWRKYGLNLLYSEKSDMTRRYDFYQEVFTVEQDKETVTDYLQLWKRCQGSTSQSSYFDFLGWTGICFATIHSQIWKVRTFPSWPRLSHVYNIFSWILLRGSLSDGSISIDNQRLVRKVIFSKEAQTVAEVKGVEQKVVADVQFVITAEERSG